MRGLEAPRVCGRKPSATMMCAQAVACLLCGAGVLAAPPAPSDADQPSSTRLFDISRLTEDIADRPLEGPRYVRDLLDLYGSDLPGTPEFAEMGMEPDRLVEFIRENVAPETWAEEESEAIAADEKGLTVRHTPAVLAQIEALLDGLRAHRARAISVDLAIVPVEAIGEDGAGGSPWLPAVAFDRVVGRAGGQGTRLTVVALDGQLIGIHEGQTRSFVLGLDVDRLAAPPGANPLKRDIPIGTLAQLRPRSIPRTDWLRLEVVAIRRMLIGEPERRVPPTGEIEFPAVAEAVLSTTCVVRAGEALLAGLLESRGGAFGSFALLARPRLGPRESGDPLVRQAIDALFYRDKTHPPVVATIETWNLIGPPVALRRFAQAAGPDGALPADWPEQARTLRLEIIAHARLTGLPGHLMVAEDGTDRTYLADGDPRVLGDGSAPLYLFEPVIQVIGSVVLLTQSFRILPGDLVAVEVHSYDRRTRFDRSATFLAPTGLASAGAARSDDPHTRTPVKIDLPASRSLTLVGEGLIPAGRAVLLEARDDGHRDESGRLTILEATLIPAMPAARNPIDESRQSRTFDAEILCTPPDQLDLEVLGPGSMLIEPPKPEPPPPLLPGEPAPPEPALDVPPPGDPEDLIPEHSPPEEPRPAFQAWPLEASRSRLDREENAAPYGILFEYGGLEDLVKSVIDPKSWSDERNRIDVQRGWRGFGRWGCEGSASDRDRIREGGLVTVTQTSAALGDIQSLFDTLFARRSRRFAIDLALIPPGALDRAATPGTEEAGAWRGSLIEDGVDLSGDEAVHWSIIAPDGGAAVLLPSTATAFLSDHDIDHIGDITPVVRAEIQSTNRGLGARIRVASTPFEGWCQLEFEIARIDGAVPDAPKKTPVGDLELVESEGTLFAGIRIAPLDRTVLLGELRRAGAPLAPVAVLGRVRQVPIAASQRRAIRIVDAGALLRPWPETPDWMSPLWSRAESRTKEGSAPLYTHRDLIARAREALPPSIAMNDRLRLMGAGDCLLVSVVADSETTAWASEIIGDRVRSLFAETFRTAELCLWDGSVSRDALAALADSKTRAVPLPEDWREALAPADETSLRLVHLDGRPFRFCAARGRAHVESLDRLDWPAGKGKGKIPFRAPNLRWAGSGIELEACVTGRRGGPTLRLELKGAIAKTEFEHADPARRDPSGWPVESPRQTARKFEHDVRIPLGQPCALQVDADPRDPARVRVLIVEVRIREAGR